MCVVVSRAVHRDFLAFDPVEINELGEITHMPFYNFNRFEKLIINTSAGAELMFAHFEQPSCIFNTLSLVLSLILHF